MHHPTDRIAHAMDFVTPVVEHWLEQEITNKSTLLWGNLEVTMHPTIPVFMVKLKDGTVPFKIHNLNIYIYIY